jgi:hypothetical protein
MLNPRFANKTLAQVCEILRKSMSQNDTEWAAIELVARRLCGPNDDGVTDRDNCKQLRYDGIIGEVFADRLVLPDSFELPECPVDVEAWVRRQRYFSRQEDTDLSPRWDFVVNTADNTLDFRSDLRLNGQLCFVEIPSSI